MNRAEKRQAIADKLAADIPRLQAEIDKRRAKLATAKTAELAKPMRGKLATGWFVAWSKRAPAIARLEGSLARAKKRAPVARTIAQEIAVRFRDQERRKKKRDAVTQSINSHFEKIAQSPHPQKQWDQERVQEERRIKKLKRSLDRRTRKDLSSPKRFMLEKPIKLPDPVEQPKPADLIEEQLPPPREGLIPGTYKVIDRSRLGGGLLDRPRLPSQWTARHVGDRLIEAHAVLDRLPMDLRPKGYGAMWPAYRHEAGEYVHQVGSGTLSIGRNVIYRTASADEIARMNEALQWPMQFLSAWPDDAGMVNHWARQGVELDEEEYPNVTAILQMIADALNAAKEVVR